MLTSTKVDSIDDSGDKVKVTISPSKGGESKVIEADRVLQAVGLLRGLRLRPGEDRREAHRAWRHRDRRLYAHQR
ncbi:dihydrolipoamide dehydrogenase [Cutibacterium acnes JCM 18920]|nr:dihydrolipoamide dehydrogenase [Cutibacterium acnes JCM 18920]